MVLSVLITEEQVVLVVLVAEAVVLEAKTQLKDKMLNLILAAEGAVE